MGRKKVIREDNPRALKQLVRDMHRSSKNVIEVGLLEGIASPASIEKAMINVYGVPGPSGGWRIPPRDFLAAAETHYVRIAKSAKPDVFNRHNRKKADGGTKNIRSLVNEYLAEVALRAAREVKRQIEDPNSEASTPRNAASTIRKKGFDNPLLETGAMAADVAYRVRQPAGKVIAEGKPE